MTMALCMAVRPATTTMLSPTRRLAARTHTPARRLISTVAARAEQQQSSGDVPAKSGGAAAPSTISPWDTTMPTMPTFGRVNQASRHFLKCQAAAAAFSATEFATVLEPSQSQPNHTLRPAPAPEHRPQVFRQLENEMTHLARAFGMPSSSLLGGLEHPAPVAGAQFPFGARALAWCASALRSSFCRACSRPSCTCSLAVLF